jgi:hypothetical protein
MASRNARSYLTEHWKPAPPKVWLWVLVMAVVGGAVGVAVMLLVL